jgi:hypothetical protein
VALRTRNQLPDLSVKEKSEEKKIKHRFLAHIFLIVQRKHILKDVLTATRRI